MMCLARRFAHLWIHPQLFAAAHLIFGSVGALGWPAHALAVSGPAFDSQTQSQFTTGNPSHLTPNNSPERPDGTLGFIAYLDSLLKRQIVGDNELVALIEALEKGRVTNPILPDSVLPSGAVAFHHSSHQVHHEGFQAYLDRTALNPQALLLWAEANLKRTDGIRERRERARIETLEMYQKIKFNFVAVAKATPQAVTQAGTQTATEPFDLMSTPVTQKHWSMVMGQNPSRFALGDRTVVMTIGGNTVYMQPDNPVEQVSWNDVQTFIQQLNQLSLNNDPLLYELIVDHHAGDQFGLPSDAQWLAVASNHGTAQGKYFFGDNEADLIDYAWYIENSHGTTHPVAELRPFIVDGMEFYDILGDVWEWMVDAQVETVYPEYSHPCLEKFNRVKTQIEHVLRGGRWAASAHGLRTSNSITARPEARSDGSGFRLVRIKTVRETWRIE